MNTEPTKPVVSMDEIMAWREAKRMTTHQTETHNLPSASNFARYAACPGSFLMERDLPDDESPDAAQGTLIHAILAGEQTGEVTDPEVMAQVDACREILDDLLERSVGNDPGTFHRERRLWIRDVQHLDRLYSGKPDGIWCDGTRAVVWDFKTGRVPVTPADANWQLRALAALVAYTFGVSEVLVAIIQPWASPRLTQCLYDREALTQADVACGMVATNALQPGQARYASIDACRYCKAKGFCPEAAEIVPQLGTMTVREQNGEVDTPTLLRLLNQCGHAERVIGAIRARAKGILIKDPHALPGWNLRTSKPRETIEDTERVWNQLGALGVQANVFIEACKITKKDLQALLRASIGLKGKELESVFAKVTEGALTYGNPTVTLERVAVPDTATAEAVTEALTE